MGIAYNTSIVRDGLVVHLDAANKKSIPETTIWMDMSGNGNNATLQNGSLFDPNTQTIVFDGVDDFATIPIPQIQGLSVVTVDVVLRWRGRYGIMFFGFDGYCIYTAGGNIGFNNGASNVVGISSTDAQKYIGEFAHYTFVMRSGVLMSTNKIFINGEDQIPIIPRVASDGVGKPIPNKMSLAIWNSYSTSWIGDVDYKEVRVYDRELTETEVKQNFEATRHRYGI